MEICGQPKSLDNQKRREPQNEDHHKNENHLKNEDNQKNWDKDDNCFEGESNPSQGYYIHSWYMSLPVKTNHI